MENNRNFLNQMVATFNTLSMDRKVLIGVLLAVFIGGLWFWIGNSKQPNYALLYGDLELKDSGEMVAELQNQNIPYKVTNNGRSIWVPEDSRDNARIALAMSDVLPSGPVGFELFDKTNLGLSEFTQNINKERAITGELERTLKAIDGVELARVHLNMPEPSPFIEDEAKTTAAVMLKLSPKARNLGQGKVAAIQNLVASAIGGMEPGAVTIMDDKANLLTRDLNSQDDFSALPDQLAIRRNVEEAEAAKVKGILEKRFGIDNVAVGVNVEMNFDKVEKETKDFKPQEGTVKGVINKEELTDEKTEGTGAQPPQGVPGTTSNVPGYAGVQSGEYKSQNSTESKEYSVSESWEHTVVAQGDIKKMSVSVLINAEEEDSALVGEVEQLVKAAVNLDTVRGDIVSVKMMPFDMTLENQFKDWDKQQGSKEIMGQVMKWLPSALILIIAIVIFMRLLKPIKEGYKVPRIDELTQEDSVELPEGDPEAKMKAKIREEITRIADDDPSSTARIIRTWMSD